MICVCYSCLKIRGEKEPLNDKTKTHGLCIECLEMEFIKLGLPQGTICEKISKLLTNEMLDIAEGRLIVSVDQNNNTKKEKSNESAH